MKERDKQQARRFGLLEKAERLEKDLLGIKRIMEVEFDLSGFYDGLQQVIFLVKYDIPVVLETYYQERRRLVADVLSAAQANELSRTGDRIEDYGEHFYFVMQCNGSWKAAEPSAKLSPYSQTAAQRQFPIIKNVPH